MEGQEPCGSNGTSPASILGTAFSAAKSALGSAWNAATKDGTLAAAGRQGADELGAALKAFPDSIQVNEPGTIWNPTQGEIAAARNPDMPSPSEIAKGGKANGMGTGSNATEVAPLSPSSVARANAASVYGPDQPLPSPGEIARDKGDVLTQEKQGWQERENDRRQKASQDGNAENDQNERAKGRSLPDEQKQQEKDRGRGR